jgi:hypothetical protein
VTGRYDQPVARKIGDTCPAGNLAAARNSVTAPGGPPGLPAAGAGESRQALAMQRAAIDALPEAELRRLLRMIGGMDPAALQRAAALYTETFCAVAEMKGSVAALEPVALARPGTDPQDLREQGSPVATPNGEPVSGPRLPHGGRGRGSRWRPGAARRSS